LSISTLLVLLYAENIAHDYRSYLIFYGELEEFDSLESALYGSRFEPGFVTISYFLSWPSFMSGSGYFVLLATVSLIIKYVLFKKYLNAPNFAWLIYVVLFLPALEASQIRTAIATIVILYVMLREVRNEGFIFPAVLASLFHYAGLIILFFHLQKHLVIGLIAIPVLLLLFISFDIILAVVHTDLIPFRQFASTAHTNHVNLFSSVFILQFLILLIGALNWNKLNQSQKKGLSLIIIGTVLYIGFYYNPGIAHRLREISLLGIFPLLFSGGKIKVNYSLWAMRFCVLCIVLYSLFYTLLRFYNSY